MQEKDDMGRGHSLLPEMRCHDNMGIGTRKTTEEEPSCLEWI